VLVGDHLRRSIAEFVGTFALIFAGAGAVAFARTTTDIALANGLVIAVMVSAVGLISGGFFNPAITIAFLITRRIHASLATLYLVVQFGAAALAALLLKWVLPKAAADATHLGAPALSSISSGKGVVVEAVLTFFLVWVVFATAVDRRGTFKQIAGLAIGLTIVFDALVGVGLTGAAMNPARAFGPELVANDWTNFWVWYVGPIAGGAIAALLYEGLYLGPQGLEVVGSAESGIDEEAPGTAALE
jgi:aquaporin TIP